MSGLCLWIGMALLLTSCLLSLSSAQTVTVTGTNVTAGSNQVVTCAVDPAEPGVTYMFEWRRGVLVVQQASTESTYQLRVQLSDAGDDYQCVIRRSDNSVVGSEAWTLRVTIPNFDWRVTRSSLSFYVGLNFSIIFTSLLENVGSVAAEVTIRGPSGVIASGKEGDRVRTFDVETNDGNFEKMVQFTPLSVVDRGIYTCTGTVMPSEANAFITNGQGEHSADVLNLPIPVPVISLGVAIPPPSPQRLLDIPPFNFLTLSCSAEITVRANRVPFSITFSWQRSVSPSATREDLPSNSFTNDVIFGSMATSVLSINTTLSGNHTYVCCVTLDVIPAPDNITADSTQPITVYGQANPAPPVNLTTPIVRHNRVTVEWQISLLTYDPETYHVVYGTNQSNLSLASAAVSGTTLELEELMFNTGYYYQIVATNSVGASSSETSSFTTTLTPPLPPTGLVFRRDEDSLTTYTFSWVRPVDEGGQIRRFRVKCTPAQVGVSTPKSVEVAGAATSARLTGFDYLQTYNCLVQAGSDLVYFNSSNTINLTVTEGVPDVVSCGNGRWVNKTPFSQQEGVANVTVSWMHPRDSRGILLYYFLSFTTYDGSRLLDNVTIDASLISYTFTALTLEPGVPYNVSVLARNSFAPSPQACYFTDFIQQLTPPNVSGLKVTRLSGTRVEVEWLVPSLQTAGGFLTYIVSFTASASGGNRRRQNEETCAVSPCSVPVQVGGVNLTGLDPSSSYYITVTGVNEDGMMGEQAVSTVAPPESGSKLTLVLVVVVVVTFCLIVLIVLLTVIMCCCWRKKAGLDKESSYNELELKQTTDYRTETEVSKDRAPFYTPMQMSERVQPIPTSNFYFHVKEMHNNRDKLFEMEYESFGSNPSSSCDVAKVNKSKNRFANIFPYDFSRVKLEAIEGVEESDYINASYLDGYGQLNAYIAAQGPMPNTVGDFWRMIWEHKLSTVVMLTKVVEGGKKKCEHYWPERVSEKLVPPGTSLQVTFTDLMPFADYEIRKFEVLDVSYEGVPLLVTHYQFLGWPDHGVPKFATSLIEFNRRVKHEYQPGHPILVHCSAGVGRTGTYITLDAMLERKKVEESICVYEFVRNMRAKRVFMVQTQQQYVFIHDALDELITCGDTSIGAPSLRDTINILNKVDPETATTGFEDQFKTLQEVSREPSNCECSDALQHYNESKNRYQHKVPYNTNRVRLRVGAVVGSEYINASFIDGYKHRNAYIATQAPLENTVQDFWHMIWEFSSRSVVMLCPTDGDDGETMHMYWPEKLEQKLVVGMLVVTLKEERTLKGYVEKKLHIREDKIGSTSNQGFLVTLYHYEHWPEHDRPPSSTSLLHLIANLNATQRQTGNKPITVMCNDGIGRTGSFLVIHAMMERVKTENILDFFQFVKSSRIHKANIVLELEHYRFCHDTLADFLESLDSYANFKDLSAPNTTTIAACPPKT